MLKQRTRKWPPSRKFLAFLRPCLHCHLGCSGCEKNTPLSNISFPSTSGSRHSAMSAGELPLLIGGGLIMSTGELSPVGIERLHGRSHSGTAARAQLWCCKVSSVDIGLVPPTTFLGALWELSDQELNSTSGHSESTSWGALLNLLSF